MNDYQYLMNHEHHYVTFSNYLKDRFGEKCAKISFNIGCTCPNRDGAKGVGGCLYCSKNLSGDFAGKVSDSIAEQFRKGKELMHQKWDASIYIAYLQAGTNTYGDLNELKNIYNAIISLDPNIKVLSIATRPDCINKEIIEALKEINNKCEVWVELGFQSMYDETKSKMNCLHTTADFLTAIKLLNEASIKTVVHVINGLPGETTEMMLETIKFVNALHPFGIKIHMLHLMKDTLLGEEYLKEPFPLLSKEQYVELVSRQLSYINTSTIIFRLTGDAPKDDIIEPLWTLKKFVVLNDIDKYMRKNNIYQGDLCKK